MLRSVCFKNFVRFKEHQEFDFSMSGPFIFIGENGSGKSSVFEGIRRCLKLGYSTSISTVLESNSPSYFICNFEIKMPGGNENIICGIVSIPATSPWINESYTKTKTLDEGSSREDINRMKKQPDGQKNDMHYYKFAMKCSQSEPMYINLIDKSDGKGLTVSKRYKINSCEFTHERQDFINTILKKREKGVDKHIERIQRYINTIFESINDRPEETDNELELILNTLTNNLVFTFPLRSIGPLQWSKSELIHWDRRKENYEEAEKRCEIIKHYLKEQKNFELYDENKEQKYFEQLTQSNEYIFKLNMQENIVVSDDKFALLKTPEGILEAKAFSILMSSKQYKTIFLEEPDRGMHPQLVERMIQVIDQEKNEKRVLLITHQKGFITPWTVSNTFVFRRFGDENRIISGKYIFGDGRDANMKKMTLLTSHHVPDILFATKVLFYEGDSEDLFFRELRRQILTEETAIASKLSNGDVKVLANVKNYLMEYTFIKMNGWKNLNFFQKISSKLLLDHLFLVDLDAVLNMGKIKKEIDNEEKKTTREKLLQSDRIFFWLNGTIEDMVCKMCDNDSVLKAGLQKLRVVSMVDKTTTKTGIFSQTVGKLFKNAGTKSNHITDSVKLILDHCEEGDDIAEIIKALLKCSSFNHVRCKQIEWKVYFCWIGFIFCLVFLYGTSLDRK